MRDQTRHTTSDIAGVPAHVNWLKFVRSEESLGILEYALLSDVHFVGESVGLLGPYSILNNLTLPLYEGEVRPALTLRFSVHDDFEPLFTGETDTTRYHGGALSDEIAAYVSLFAGCRVQSGDQSRLFEVSGDPLGRPALWDRAPLPQVGGHPKRRILPGVLGERSLTVLEPLAYFPRFSPARSVAATRSARLYQAALWSAEIDPNMAWLLLVGAVECAAGFEDTSRGSPLERLASAKPELVQYLSGLPVEGIEERIAEEFSGSIGSTRKFVEFLLTYLPNLPERPPLTGSSVGTLVERSRIEWTADVLRPLLRKVYSYRSKALHGGVPFPAPMCGAPLRLGREPLAERPIGAGTMARGGAWASEDLPMHLHIFEHLVRGALVRWWTSSGEA